MQNLNTMLIVKWNFIRMLVLKQVFLERVAFLILT